METTKTAEDLSLKIIEIESEGNKYAKFRLLFI